ncbi:hypothetical protein SADUNF_Sadunf10G0162600 [Salix dunnii]|uniref:SOSEKI DIX-like domain-containing protein n=1 Tax=Salix dunnii TaxID=1413687 RepID=A0A835MVB1_9ROSI|nr:hypothetical protein SADUNF_Sadunf10G0162600 [Salix dunnii]
MATDPADRRELLMPTKYQDRENNPERTKMLNPPKSKSEQKVGVVYYLTRNGQFEHPHFMEVHLSSPQGLQLKDVKDKINHLRGQGMANMYSWSSKRRYKNGFVWQDLSETDYIQACHGHEYILKGSLLLETSLSFRSHSTTSSRTSKVFSDIIINSSEGSNSPVNRRTNRSRTTFDEVDENKVHRAKITGEIASKGVSNVSKHTTDRGRVNIDGNEELGHELLAAIEPSREEASRLSLKSSSKALESLETSMVANRSSGTLTCPSGRMKPSMVMMKLIGCGSKIDLRARQSNFTGFKRTSAEARLRQIIVKHWRLVGDQPINCFSNNLAISGSNGRKRSAPFLLLPFTVTEIEGIKSNFEKICGLPDFCDSIDATHIVMILSTVGRSNGVRIDSEKNHRMLLQTIVDQDMRFCDVIVGHPVVQNSSLHKLSMQVKWLNEKEKNRTSTVWGDHLTEEVLDELPSSHQHDSDYLQQICETASKTGIGNQFKLNSEVVSLNN